MSTPQMSLHFGDIDQGNVPPGMMAIRKDSLTTHDNICNHCDYRRGGCQDDGPSLIRCMSYARPDGIGVLFVRR